VTGGKYCVSRSKKRIIHHILIALLCLLIAFVVLTAIDIKNREKTFSNNACIRLEEKYQRTVQVIRHTLDYHAAEAVQVRFADEPEVEFFAWKNNDTYFEAYLAWDATRMLEDAFPDFTVRADVYLPGGDAKGDADRLRFYKENGMFRLQPENQTMKPILTKEVYILGKVVADIRYYN